MKQRFPTPILGLSKEEHQKLVEENWKKCKIEQEEYDARWRAKMEARAGAEKRAEAQAREQFIAHLASPNYKEKFIPYFGIARTEAEAEANA